MLSSQFVFVCLVSSWIGGSSSIPLTEREFFYFPTDQDIVPAFLRGHPGLTDSVNAVEDDVVFWHYLIGESEGRVVTPGCDQCLSNFITGAPTIFLAHGFGSSHTGGFGTSFREGFKNRSELVNLIFINWSKLAPSPWYEYAANNVKPVGEYTASMINFIVEQGVTSHENIIFVGHSLGSHMANYISPKLNNGKIHRVFALDPALPLFGQKDDSERIDPTDGDFVHVLHTSMGTLLDGGVAFTEPRGHVDFYPNSGKNQPGCSKVDFGACSHSRAYRYLSESVANPNAFPACKCTNWEEYDSGECTCEDEVNMAWDTPETTRGVYYTRTNADSPYGQR